MRQAVIDAISATAQRTGLSVAIEDRELRVEDRLIELPAEWDNLRMRHALPYAARGDQREKLLFSIIEDAGPQRDHQKFLDEQLRVELEDYLEVPGARSSAVLADAMREEYWTQPGARPFLLPYHADLPLSFSPTVLDMKRTGTPRYERDGRRFTEARYRMFRGNILPFLCTMGDGSVDEGVIGELLGAVGGEDGVTLLDTLFLEAARTLADGAAGVPTADRLMERSSEALAGIADAGGPFCQHSMDRFRRDLRITLRMELPRADRIAAITQVISLHLGVYYYRLALVLGLDLEAVAASTSGQAAQPGCACDGLAGCPLAGAMKVRAPSRGFRSVSVTSPCRESYLLLDRDRLLALPANIVTANLLERVLAGLTGEPSREGAARPGLIAERISRDPGLRARVDAASSALAALYAGQASADDSMLQHLSGRAPGPFALQSAVLQLSRNRLKYTSRDVVNQLLHRPGEGSLLRRNGSLYYFEMDEDMLFLLVKLICSEDTLPLDSFLAGLAEYGLAPQDRAEVDALAARLEELGMLTRYSDAGESTYVRHIF